ncbi:vacuolar protein 14 C-terminal Fig4p binding-domain-containing protein [Phlyctochytrium arcticum]|nr:vacuolar protein 14 C-terminal Fig4p binding-domain-containing protein [Phlyctochytrium arcticum]
MAPQQEATTFTPQIVRGLGDKLYEKRKAAALEVERLIRDAISVPDHARVSGLLRTLIDDFAYSSLPNARNGGLIALAAGAIALGTVNLSRHLDGIVPPILSCFSDQDSRVRYYACESMYNVAKVARGDILKYFNEIFDALCKLSSDAEPSVKNGAELLDRLMKDIVSERSVYWAPPQQDTLSEDPSKLEDKDPTNLATSGESYSIGSRPVTVPGSVPLLPGMKPTQFNLPRFIPLLAERIHTLAPFTRTFLVQWISVLDSVPDLELIAYLPDFLDGLFNYLSDPNIDVRVATLNVLGEFLKELRDVIETQRNVGVLKIRGKTPQNSFAPNLRTWSDPTLLPPPYTDGAEGPGDAVGRSVKSGFGSGNVAKSGIVGQEEAPKPTRASANESPAVPPKENQLPSNTAASTTGAMEAPSPSAQANPNPVGSQPYIAGLGVELDIGRMTEILIHHLMSTDEETQAMALRWINEFILLAREVMLPYSPQLLNAILPCLAHSVAGIRNIAVETNNNLYKLILDLPAGSASAQPNNPTSIPSFLSSSPGTQTDALFPPAKANTTTSADIKNVAGVATAQLDSIDLQATVETLTLQFQDEREETRVAALEWLLMLHRKVPKQVLSSDDATFQVLLRTLSDSSEEVVKRDLQLLAQVSQHSDDEYFARFMVNLLTFFSTDRRLLETRGSLIIRQLCLSLHSERMYRTFAETLEREEDLEFASTMVQNLNFILITAPELADLRRRLKNLDTKDGVILFSALYRSWCHNAVAVFSLCLLAQAYEHAATLLTLFADLEISVSLLIQVDKLVQLLESPVFTYLRLQLLEPERYPYLFKCLYGILMLLPQSSAFATLRNRLNSVSSMVFMFSGPGSGGMGPGVQSGMAAGSGGGDPSSRAERQSPPVQVRRTRPLGTVPGDASPPPPPQNHVRWTDLLQHFRSVQSRHERSRRLVARSSTGLYTGFPSGSSSSPAGSSIKRRSRSMRSAPGDAADNEDYASTPPHPMSFHGDGSATGGSGASPSLSTSKERLNVGNASHSRTHSGDYSGSSAQLGSPGYSGSHSNLNVSGTSPRMATSELARMMRRAGSSSRR